METLTKILGTSYQKIKKLDFYKTLLVFVVIIVGFIAYQNLVAIPRDKLLEAQKAEANKAVQKIFAEGDYVECKQNAYVAYSEDWASACDIKDLKSDCSLPVYISDGLNASYKDRLSRCFDEYSLKIK